MREEDGPVDDVGHAALGRLGDVVAEHVGVALLVGDGRVLLVEPLDGLLVLHAHEGPRRLLEVRVERLDVPAHRVVRQHLVDDARDELLDVLEQVVKLDEVELGFHVGVLGQMTPRQALLGAERLLDAVHVAQRLNDRLEIQLARLREVGLLPVVVVLEQRSAALDLGLHHGRGRDLAELHLAVAVDKRQLDELAQLHHG